MPALSNVYNQAQLGKQVSAGTGVAADKLLQSFGFERFAPQADGGQMFIPQGQKINTIAVPPGKQWTDISYNGVMTFNELVYMLACHINNPTVTTDGTNGKVWVFTSSKGESDTKAIYTMEIGNATRAKKSIDVHGRDFTLEMGRDTQPTISGNLRGAKLLDDVTITAAPTEINPKIIAPQKFDVYLADTAAGLPGASVWPLPLMARFSFPVSVSELYRMNSTDTSFHALIDQALGDITLEFETGDDDLDYAALWPLVDTGATKFIRIKATGDVIAGAAPSAELFQLDFAGKLISREVPGDREGAATNTFTFQNVWDTTAGYSFSLRVVNTLAAL